MPLSILCSIPLFALLLSYGLFRATKLPLFDNEHFTSFVKGLRIGGHRGMMALTPESTIAGIRKVNINDQTYIVINTESKQDIFYHFQAKAFGADWVDLDMQITLDGVPVVFNGYDLSRTTNGSGPVSAYILAKLKLLNAADKFHDKEQFPYAAIPTVVEAIQECIELEMKIAIEVKYHEDKTLEALNNILSKFDTLQLQSHLMIVSMDPFLIYLFRRQHPQIISGHAWRPNYFACFGPNYYFACFDSSCVRPKYPNYVWRQLAANVVDVGWTWIVHNLLFRVTGASLLWVDHDSVTRQYIDSWKSQQVQVIAFTVNDVYEKRFLLHTLQCPFVTDDCSDIHSDPAPT